jgi:glycosyltransferase involved in cell wall biosynthesis
MLLPNSENEYKRLVQTYGIEKKYVVVPNGADTAMFRYSSTEKKDPDMVLCVARIELIKNQLNLVKALNGSRFRLYLVGDPAPNHQGYYRECKKAAAANIYFVGSLSQEDLVKYYSKAKVHVLPSWFETTGLSSLEALHCGCNIVVTRHGDTEDYFDKQHCFYCDPGSVGSIKEAIEKAAEKETDAGYIRDMAAKYNWQKAAEKTLEAYKEVKLNTQR